MFYRLIFSLIGALLCSSTALSQGTCHIKGRIHNNALRTEGKTLSTIYLSVFDEYDRIVAKDSVQLKDGKFEFIQKVDANSPILLYLLTGFDNGQVPVFVEPGTITIDIPQAAYPGGGVVSGTKNNDLYREYKAISDRCVQIQKDSLSIITKQKGEGWLDTPEGNMAWMRVGAEAMIQCDAERLEFLLKHSDTPLAPLMLEREIGHMLQEGTEEQFLSALSPDLKDHPYYRSFSNSVKARNLKVGAEVPNITLTLADGSKKFLNDYRGKYVILDFWASWCGPCLREIPHLVELYEEFVAKDKKLALISFSLDDKEKAWKGAISSKGIDKEHWVHASDLLAWGSPAARMFGVKAVPMIILIDPEGNMISSTLRGEELVRRVRQIMSGDLYYEGSGSDE
ncbi:MAG: TlpA disulfide reductase family protein [Porphyromonas sp.]|nr:TlpA disulfide reductase family protein [Porphyromonas sp.]